MTWRGNGWKKITRSLSQGACQSWMMCWTFWKRKQPKGQIPTLVVCWVEMLQHALAWVQTSQAPSNQRRREYSQPSGLPTASLQHIPGLMSLQTISVQTALRATFWTSVDPSECNRISSVTTALCGNISMCHWHWSHKPSVFIVDWPTMWQSLLHLLAVPLLRSPYWLPVRLEYCSRSIFWPIKCCLKKQPLYPQSMLGASLPSHSLRSNKDISQLDSWVKTTTGVRAFHSCAPSL